MRTSERIIKELKRVANAFMCIAETPMIDAVEKDGFMRSANALERVANALTMIKHTPVTSVFVSDAIKLLTVTCDSIECIVMGMETNRIHPRYFVRLAEQFEKVADKFVHFVETQAGIEDGSARIRRSLMRVAVDAEAHLTAIHDCKGIYFEGEPE